MNAAPDDKCCFPKLPPCVWKLFSADLSSLPINTTPAYRNDTITKCCLSLHTWTFLHTQAYALDSSPKYCTYLATDCLRRDERKQTDYHLDIMSELKTHIKSLLGIPPPTRTKHWGYAPPFDNAIYTHIYLPITIFRTFTFYLSGIHYYTEPPGHTIRNLFCCVITYVQTYIVIAYLFRYNRRCRCCR